MKGNYMENNLFKTKTHDELVLLYSQFLKFSKTENIQNDEFGEIIKEYHKKYPQYDFEKNVGYGTKTHVDALKEVGPTEIHRISFLKNIL